MNGDNYWFNANKNYEDERNYMPGLNQNNSYWYEFLKVKINLSISIFFLIKTSHDK